MGQTTLSLQISFQDYSTPGKISISMRRSENINVTELDTVVQSNGYAA